MTRSMSLMLLSLLPACQQVSPTGVSDESGRDRPDESSSGGSFGTGGDDADVNTEPGASKVELPEATCSAEGGRLLTLINLYRSENGRPGLPQSEALCLVAEAHVDDLISQTPYLEAGCGAKSWSSEGPWDGCCYREDNSNPECMWDKPEELAGYSGLGYEAVAINVTGLGDAFEKWKEDPGLNEMILGEGQWAGTPWHAIGAAYVDGHASLWLGDAAESQ